MKLQEILLDNIDLADETFLVRERKLDDNLLSSIRTTGVVTPPWLRLKADGAAYQVVMGFRRVSALRQLGSDSVCARVIEDGEFSDLELMESALLENLSNGPLDPMEISRVFSRLRLFGASVDSLATRFLPLLGLRSSDSTVERYLSLIDLPDDITSAISSGEVSLDLIERVERHFDGDDGTRVIRLILDLRLGVNRQRELLRLLDEIGRRDEVDVAHILADHQLSSIMEETGANLPQKAQALIAALRNIRAPETMALAGKARERIRRLGLDKSIGVEVSPYLEERLIRISFGFRSPEEYGKILDDLIASGESGEIAELMDELFGGPNHEGDEKDE